MATTRGIKGYFDFSKGVVTEGSALTYAENSLLDSLNVSFTPGKPLAKRLGMAVNAALDNYTSTSQYVGPADGAQTGAWYWEAPAGNADLSTMVVGMGNSVYGISVAGALVSHFEIDLDDLLQEEFRAPPGLTYFQCTKTSFTAISNKLFVVMYGSARGNVASRVVTIEFPRLVTVGFTEEPITSILDIQYRDFGDASTMDLNDPMNPSAYPDEYGAVIYDLFNRGFPHVTGPYYQTLFRIMDSSRGEYAVGGRDPIGYYFARIGRYPTKGTVFPLGLGTYPELVNDTPRQDKVWDVDPYRTQNLNFGSAATGHVILSAYDPQRWLTMMKLMDRDDVSEIGTTPNPSSEIFTTAAAWYGRACFGTASGKIFLSQLYKDSRNNIAGKCYQEQDPTDADFNELLATDGTVIDIGGAGSVLGMVPLGNSLVVVTNQGVWQLEGSAESYSIQAISVSKLLADSCSEPESLVSFPGGVAFFADSSIYVVQRDPTVGTLSPTSVSDETIKTLYVDTYSSGVVATAFDYKNKRIEWLFSDGRILQFDVRTGAFFPQKIEGSNDRMFYLHRTPRLYEVPQDENVTSNGENVTSNGEQVTTVASDIGEGPDTGLNYYQVYSINRRLVVVRGSLISEAMVDYGTEEYRAYAEAGYDTFSDPTANKEIDTLFAWLEITEDGIEELGGGQYDLLNQSACELSVKWEWSSTEESNRWYNVGNIYQLPVNYIVDDDDLSVDFGYTVAPVTRGIPGAGKSVVFRFDDQPGKKMRLLGWAVAAANEVNP